MTDGGLLMIEITFLTAVLTLSALFGVDAGALQVPAGEQPLDPSQPGGGTSQTFVGGVFECLVTFFGDCDQRTVSSTWRGITDTINTSLSYVSFLFSLFVNPFKAFGLPGWASAIVMVPIYGHVGYLIAKMVRGN